MWIINVTSKLSITESDRELIVQYACSEGKRAILHDVLETSKSLELVIESEKEKVQHLASILDYDFRYKVNLSKIV